MVNVRMGLQDTSRLYLSGVRLFEFSIVTCLTKPSHNLTAAWIQIILVPWPTTSAACFGTHLV